MMPFELKKKLFDTFMVFEAFVNESDEIAVIRILIELNSMHLKYTDHNLSDRNDLIHLFVTG